VVEAQTEFLRTRKSWTCSIGKSKRLKEVSAGGQSAGKAVLERQYEQQKLKAVQRAQRERLLLHGSPRSMSAESSPTARS